MSTKPLLVLGSANRKKVVELAELFSAVGIRLQTLADYEQALDVVEDGGSFAENAALKAVGQARHLDRWVLAEDSGLAVDALDGAPGIYSARYSGEGATDETNIRLTLSDRTGKIRAESEASCAGRIVFEPLGSNGFGYDPVFEVIEYHRTFGQLSASVKACLSHRARAARRLIPSLTQLVDSGQLI